MSGTLTASSLTIIVEQRLDLLRFVGESDALQPHHLAVDSAGEATLLIVDIGDAARHARAEIAPCRAQHDDRTASHIFAAVVPYAFDDGHGPTITHCKALTHLAAHQQQTASRTIKYGITGNDLFVRLIRAACVRSYDALAASHTLSHVVIG